MLNSYKKYLKREGKVQLDILKLLGFFDRAISFEVIDMLKNKSLIKNINDNLINISEKDWKYALNDLKELHLISESEKVLDTHPLVREYFSKYVEENYTNSYIEGQYVLYKYYENLQSKYYPDTIEEMEPLFQSIYHACKANRYEEAINLFTIRIDRAEKKMNYLTIKLGRFDLYFKLMSYFFEKKFSKITDKIPKYHHLKIFTNIAYYFSTKNDNDKALQIYLNLLKDTMNSNDRYTILSNILDLYLYMGNFKDLESIYFRNLNKTDVFSSKKEEALFIVTFAYYKFLSGKLLESDKIFKECELLLKNSGEFGLHNFAGYMYKNLLFYKKDFKTFFINLKESLRISNELEFPLDIGLNHILLAKYNLVKGENTNEVIKRFNKAI
jgi:hypothetical protein